MQIIREKTKYHEYAWLFDYQPEIVEFARQLKDKYGWQEFGFDTVYKRWRFRNPAIFDEIKTQYPQVKFDLILQELLHIRKMTVYNKISTIDWQLKGKLRDYQIAGVEFFLQTNGRAILADDMGVGKTVQAIGYLVAKGVGRTLVICPASAKYVWDQEIQKWSNLSALVIDGEFAKRLLMEAATEVNKHQVLIVNYDLLKKYLPLLTNISFECLIVDEFHMIKSVRAARTKFTKLIGTNIPHILLLSGTPMTSRPVELYNGLYLLDRQAWPNWYQFTVRYCAGHRTRFGWDATGASNLEELRERIKPYFLRRTKAEILKELPPKNFVDVPLELTEEEISAYVAAEEDFVRYLEDYKGQNARDKQALALVKLGELRQLTSKGKIDGLKDLIDNILEGEEKVLVFSVYNEPLEKLYQHYQDRAVMLIGKTPTIERKAIEQKFQTDPNVRIFFGGTTSAGISITLTAASNVVFLDYSWTPADMEQAQDRAHRLGQKAESLNIYQLCARGTIDDYMVKLLQKKRQIIDQVIEGVTPEWEEDIAKITQGMTPERIPEREKDIINAVIEQLELKYAKPLST